MTRPVELPGAAVEDPFAAAESLAAELCEVAGRHGLPAENFVQAMLGVLGRLVSVPNTAFPDPPEYVRELGRDPAVPSAPPIRSTHGFFEVLGARTSRRDFGTDPLDVARLQGLLTWTFGARGYELAYDYRDAPLRYVPSAGGLASTDAYVIVNNVDGLAPGSYYYDYRAGLVEICQGMMAQKLAGMNPGQEWLGRAAAVVVVVANVPRLEHKYGVLGFKLALLDAGVAVGHAELVCNALELRATILGGLPADEVSTLLRIDGRNQVPLASLAVGTRSGFRV